MKYTLVGYYTVIFRLVYTQGAGIEATVLVSTWAATGSIARIFKLLSRPGIDSNESIPPAYVAWQAGTTTLFLLGS
jgi:hypothetical protein